MLNVHSVKVNCCCSCIKIWHYFGEGKR